MADEQKQQQRFQGKVVIITGSSAGIGQAAAIEFAREGAAVVIHGRDGQRLNETEQKVLALEVSADRILKVQGPIEEENTAHKLVEETVKKFGRIDVLVNNAGCAAKPGNEDPMDVAHLDHLYNVNMRSIVVLTNLAMPHLEKSRGNVLNVSSCASHRFMSARVRPHYAVMKAALDHWTRIMALIWGEKSGVRVNSINPGPISDTLITDNCGQRGPVEQRFGNSAVLKRLGLPSEVVPAMKLLCSDDGAYITGVCLLIDGGVALCN